MDRHHDIAARNMRLRTCPLLIKKTAISLIIPGKDKLNDQPLITSNAIRGNDGKTGHPIATLITETIEMYPD